MNYLLDCGSHYFQGLNKLNNIYHFDNNWTIYSFEANTQTFLESIKYKPHFTNLFHINKAISTHNGSTIVNCDINFGQGSNILSNPPSQDIVYGNFFQYTTQNIATVDLCDLIENIKCDKLIIKLDIEGEEFNVLPKIIDNNIYKKINTLYVEFHERFFIENIEEYIQKKNFYIEFFLSNNIDIVLWD